MKCRIGVLAAAALILASSASAAIVEGQTPTGNAFVTGGVGIEEVDALRARQGSYSLKLIMASQYNGAYLSGTQVRITGPSGVVFDQVLPGPWLMIDLPAGRYQVVASNHGQTVSRTVSASRSASPMVLPFKVPDTDAISSITASSHPPR